MSALAKDEPANERHYDYHGWIRRIDLSLRTHYPNLETRIFEVRSNQYVIVFDRATLDALAIKDEFKNGIRFMTTNAVVANDVPDKYLREISPLRDDEIARGYAGVPFTLPDINNLVAARFPKLPIVVVRDGGNPMMITVELSENISKDDEEDLLAFCNGLEALVPWRLVNVPRPDALFTNEPAAQIPGAESPMLDPNLLAVRATRRRPYLPEYVRRDEAFWFDNIDKIYAGGMPVVAFPGVQQNQSQCFVDLTTGDHINLRQALLLYDTVYCSPHCWRSTRRFCRSRHLPRPTFSI